MFWNFILDDGTTQLTLNIQPVGWDSGTAHISRDTEKHGVAFDYAIGNVRYYEEGASFIKNAYALLGTEAKVNLIIQYKCAERDAWQEFYTGKLDFGTYKEFSGVDCYVMVNIEAKDVVMTFNNRFDQKVDLSTLVSFDGAALTPYTMLGINIPLKAKAIPVSDKAIVDPDTTVSSSFVGGLQAPYGTSDPIGTPTNLNINHFSVGYNNTVAAEIGNFFVGGIENNQVFNGGGTGNIGDTFIHHVPGELNPLGQSIWPLGVSPIINYTEGSPSYAQLNGECRLRVHFKGTIQNPLTYVTGSMAFLIGILPRSTRSDFGTQDADYRWIYQEMLNDSADPNDWFPPDSLININATCDVNLTLNEGDRVYMFLSMLNRTTQAQIDEIEADTSKYAFIITYDDDDSYFILENLSYGGNNSISYAKSFLINESLSRATEAITNDQMRAYSDYFGRTDSQPYATAVNGCGALEMLTNGLFIRGMDRARTNTPPIMSISLKDIFDGLNPIHNIGFGIEDDPNRAGFKMLRIEPMEYFYPNNIIFSASGIDTITRECVPAKIYSKYLFGYDKWEAQQFTGLDEFLTKREYRTSLTSVNNTLSQISSFIASGYTIEIVRRIGNTTSQDNSYDNDTFIVCVKKPEPVIYQITGQYIAGTLHFYIVHFEQNVVGKFLPGQTYIVTEFGQPPVSVTIQDTQYENFGNIQMAVSTTVDWNLSEVAFTLSGGFEVEQGNIINAANIIDPPTIYNYRISPIRNAMRWCKAIFQSYKNKVEELIFTDGDGDVYASGQLSTPDACKLESVDIQENMTITPLIFSDINEATPIFKPELVTFEYPVSYEEFLNIMANRMGLIEFEHNGVSETGWLSEFQYTFETGRATFQIIPKFE